MLPDVLGDSTQTEFAMTSLGQLTVNISNVHGGKHHILRSYAYVMAVDPAPPAAQLTLLGQLITKCKKRTTCLFFV